MFQLEAVEKGFGVSFLQAIEFVEVLIFNERGGKGSVSILAIEADFVGASLNEAGQVCNLSGVADSAFHGVVLNEDKAVHAVGTVGAESPITDRCLMRQCILARNNTFFNVSGIIKRRIKVSSI